MAIEILLFVLSIFSVALYATILLDIILPVKILLLAFNVGLFIFLYFDYASVTNSNKSNEQ